MNASTMQGKVVVVTGAGRGIGRAIALMMAAHGARVVVNDAGVSVDGALGAEKPADEVVGLIRENGGEAVANGDSVAQWDGARRIVETAVDTFGRIDAVINNAGILRDKIFHQMTEDDWESVLKVHLFGSFNVSRAAADHFKAQQSGSFVHMTSTSGLVGNFGQANYAAAKMGILGLSKSIALDMGRYNVRSNCISPFAWSRMVGSIPNTADQEKRIAKAKTLTPETIAPVAVFLASDAARDVTGQIFAVRRNEVFLINHPRPIRSMHRSEGWTPQTLAEHMLPAVKASFAPLDRSSDVFSWDPV
ncbi:SDR family oxidoreductase [Variovorax paradoxus]|uniref:SDR family oxidoreductase n=1 Tax=Variovorax paradoxus TaxID=34073 RepID=A0A5Q0M3A8_VARPD|nr:SDR family oxidoreductase [Variovorax paradoxus]QFZ84013.1 SDR family oxidoreductase [Variovorax paradoxus]